MFASVSFPYFLFYTILKFLKKHPFDFDAKILRISIFSHICRCIDHEILVILRPPSDSSK